MNNKKKYRIWVTSDKGQTFLSKSGTISKTLVFHEYKLYWLKTMRYINRNFPHWTMIIVYDSESNKEIGRYYNFDNKKTFPNFRDELE